MVRLVRREPATATEFRWDPDSGEVDTAAFDGVDTVVNLGGVGVFSGLWTESRREGNRLVPGQHHDHHLQGAG